MELFFFLKKCKSFLCHIPFQSKCTDLDMKTRHIFYLICQFSMIFFIHFGFRFQSGNLFSRLAFCQIAAKAKGLTAQPASNPFTDCTDASVLALVKAGTAHLANVTVLPSGPYMISAATFPTYFLPDRDSADAVRCGLDVEIFAGHIAPALGITRRYVGSEPFSAMTAQYNRALADALPPRGVALVEIPRLEQGGAAVSASRVRALLRAGELAAVRDLVPPTTYEYLEKHQEV